MPADFHILSNQTFFQPLEDDKLGMYFLLLFQKAFRSLNKA